jgi:hypothetical protein
MARLDYRLVNSCAVRPLRRPELAGGREVFPLRE